MRCLSIAEWLNKAGYVSNKHRKLYSYLEKQARHIWIPSGILLTKGKGREVLEDWGYIYTLLILCIK